MNKVSGCNALKITKDSWINGTLHELQMRVRCYTDGSTNEGRADIGGLLLEQTRTEIYYRLLN